MINRRLAFFLPIAVALMAASPSSPPPAAMVVLLVRHAERAPGSGDPPISELGQARAVVLSEIGKAAGVQVIITTQFQRTKQTAAPLAQALGITGIVVSTQSDATAHVSDVASAVREHLGKTILVVGHSNTVPAIVAALGGPKVPDFCEQEYDNLFTMVIDAEGGVRTVRTRFGAATPVGVGCVPYR